MVPKISIIVPVYRAERFIKKCVESILHQTLYDIELILVDDGSPDRSGLICDQYAENDIRVKVIHQSNAGVSCARNNGIKVANGEYITFVDADDWIEPEMYKELYRYACEEFADVVMCDATTVFSDGKTQSDTITQLSENSILYKSDFTPSLLLEMAGSACRCIYKNNRYNDKLLKTDCFQFPLGVKFSEDRIFNLYAFGNALRVFYVKKAFYNRYVNLESAVHSFHADYFEIVKTAHFGILSAIEQMWEDDDEIRKAYMGQFIGGAFAAINNYYYKTCPWNLKQKWNAVSTLCNDSILRSAIIETKNKSKRASWILKKNVFMLSLYSILANIKNGR